MKKVLLYIRVSTSRQDREGFSIPMQKSSLISYCKAKGWIITGIFVDPGCSGADLERPGMDALIEAVKQKKGDVVLVYKLDRLSRSQRDTLYVLEDIFEPNGVSFVSMQESFDTGSIYGKAMLSILSAFAQMERGVITERTLMGRAGRAEKGLFHGGGTDPIGYDYVDGQLEVNKAEAEQVRMVYELYADGYSISEIIRRMEGYETKHGDWSHSSTVGNVLDNPLYAGIVHFDGVAVRGQHTAIVPAEIDEKVRVRRDRLRRLSAAPDSDHLLTGFIYCASCGARYFAHKRPNGAVVYSCHSRAKKNRKMIKDPGCKAPHIPVAELDAMVEAEVLRLAEDPSQVDELAKKRTADKGSSNADTVSVEVQRIEGEINRLMDLYQHDDLAAVEEIAERIQKLHTEKIRLAPQVEAEHKPYAIESVKLVLSDIRYSWHGMSVRGRRAFLLQLIDNIRIDVRGGVSVVWSFQ